jgi:hypothetical protein
LNRADSFDDVVSDLVNDSTFIRIALDQFENAKHREAAEALIWFVLNDIAERMKRNVRPPRQNLPPISEPGTAVPDAGSNNRRPDRMQDSSGQIRCPVGGAPMIGHCLRIQTEQLTSP